jgi:DNA repair protein RecO (recombination protein O)
MSTYTVNALVLRRNNLADNDRILTLFTRERGKLSAVARGAQKPTSKFSGVSEPFTVFKALLATGKSLDVLTQCEITNAFPALRDDLDRLARASYFCELLDRFTHDRDETEAERLFDLSLSALALLQEPEAFPDIITHAYELHLLAEQGYAPVLDYCVKCGCEIERRQAGFSPALGGTLCSADRYGAEDAVGLSAEALETLRRLMEGDGAELLALRPPPKVAAEMARAMRHYIRLRAERPLKSAEFLDQLRASQ